MKILCATIKEHTCPGSLLFEILYDDDSMAAKRGRQRNVPVFDIESDILQEIGRFLYNKYSRPAGKDKSQQLPSAPTRKRMLPQINLFTNQPEYPNDK